jgi:hypothetical protein
LKPRLSEQFQSEIALNFGLLMRSLFGFGTPKGWADAPASLVFAVSPGHFGLFVPSWNEAAPMPHHRPPATKKVAWAFRPMRLALGRDRAIRPEGRGFKS